MKPEIPEIDSIEELARFWDTHEVTDYADELKEIPSPFERSEIVRVPLTAGEGDALKRLQSRRRRSSH